MNAKIRNKTTGKIYNVSSTTEHPDSSYGQPVLVDKENNAYCVVGFEPPLYELVSADVSDKETLGMILKNMRISSGKSIRDLAKECNLSKTTIVNVENGAYSPRIEIVTKILQKLGAKLTIKK